MADHCGDLPGTKTLDYIALGFVLVPAAVVAELYMRGEPIDWRRATITTSICWIAGLIFGLLSRWWQSWRTNPRSSDFFGRVDNKLWVRALVVACSVAGALFLSSFLSDRPAAVFSPIPVIIHDKPSVEEIAKTIAPISSERDQLKNQIAVIQSELNSALGKNSDLVKKANGNNMWINENPSMLETLYQIGYVFHDAGEENNEILSMPRPNVARPLNSLGGGRQDFSPLCKIIISSSKEMHNLAEAIKLLALSDGCAAIDAPPPPPLAKPSDADNPPPAPVKVTFLDYIVIRYPNVEEVLNKTLILPNLFGRPQIDDRKVDAKSAEFASNRADKLVAAFGPCNFDVRRSHKAEGNPGWPVDYLAIYIDLGKRQECH